MKLHSYFLLALFVILSPNTFAQTFSQGPAGEQVLLMGQLKDADMSPDGKRVVTVCPLGAILWDTESGNWLRTFWKEDFAIRTARFTPDGTRMLCANNNRAVLWEVETGKEILAFDLQNDPETLVFSPDGQYALLSSYVEISRDLLIFYVDFWNLNTGTLEKSIGEHENGSIAMIRFSPDGKSIATAAGDGMVRLWDVETGKLLTEFFHEMNVDLVQFTKDGKRILTKTGDGIVRLWDIETDEFLLILGDMDVLIMTCVPMPDEKSIIAVGYNRLYEPLGPTYDVASGELAIWNLETGDKVRSFRSFQTWLSDLRLSSDGSRVLLSQNLDSPELWDIAEGVLKQSFGQYNPEIHRACFSHDGSFLFVGVPRSENGPNFYQMDAVNGHIIKSFSDAYFSISSLDISPNDRFMAVNGSNVENVVKVIDIHTGEWIDPFSNDRPMTSQVSFSPDSTQLLIGKGFGTAEVAVVWDFIADEIVHAYMHPDRDPAEYENNFAIIADRSGVSALADVSKSSTRVVHPQGWASQDFLTNFVALYSPDGKIIFTENGNDRQWYEGFLWNAETHELQSRLIGMEGLVVCAAFSSDSRLLLTGGLDWNATLWDVQTANVVRKFVGHNDWVIAADLSPDQRCLITSQQVDRNAIYQEPVQPVILWDLQTGEKIAVLTTHEGQVNAVKFSPDGSRFLTAGEDGTLRIWQISDLVQNGVEDFCLY